MSLLRLWFTRLAPAAFAATYVLLAFVATPNPLSALWRPVLFAVALAVVVVLVLRLILRRWDHAVLAASVLVLAGLATWVPLMVVIGGGLWLLGIHRLRLRAGRPMSWSTGQLAGMLGMFAWALAAIAAVSVVTTVATSLPAGSRAPIGDASDRSNVVILLLDGYPRADSLHEQFGIDPAPLKEALADRGFEIAERSRANYTSTWMTLTSMVHGRYVAQVEGLELVPDDPAEQYRALMAAIGDGPVLDDLRRAGYEIVNVPSPYESAALTTADRVVAPPQLTSFELSLIQHSFAGRLLLEVAPQIAFEQHRDRVRTSLDLAVAEAAGPRDGPMLLFAHLMAPHAPVSFTDDPAPACFPACSLYVMGPQADWSGYAEHLATVNALLLDAIDAILASDPSAMIVLMSDHGTVRGGEHGSAHAFRSFFAARTPGGSPRFPDDVSPVDVLRLISDPSAAPTQPYRAWVSEQEAPMSVETLPGDVTP